MQPAVVGLSSVGWKQKAVYLLFLFLLTSLVYFLWHTGRHTKGTWK